MKRPWMTKKPKTLSWRLARYRWENGIHTPVDHTLSVREAYEAGVVRYDGRFPNGVY